MTLSVRIFVISRQLFPDPDCRRIVCGGGAFMLLLPTRVPAVDQHAQEVAVLTEHARPPANTYKFLRQHHIPINQSKVSVHPQRRSSVKPPL